MVPSALANNLAVPQDYENAPGNRVIALVHLHELDFDLGAVLKHQADIVLAIPHERLLHLGNVGTEDKTLGRSDLLGEVAAQGQVGEIQILL